MSSFEHRRLAIQADCDAGRTPRQRNRLGQFATPTGLAADILDHARNLLPPGAPVRFLDPALGTGSFYSAFLRAFPGDRIAAAVGYEIDPHYGEPTQSLWSDTGLDLKLEDFTQAQPPREGFNLIIGNPPYVRHHHIDAPEKARLIEATQKACGVRIPGRAGLYCYFLGLAHAWLAEDGIAGWLIPSEFMDVNYGGAVKTYLLTQVELLQVHRFDPIERQFGDALVSSAVVWFRKRTPSMSHCVDFTYGGTLSQPARRLSVPASALLEEAKWTRFPEAGVRTRGTGPRLADFFKVQRGMATGNNNFFILTRQRIAERNLPAEFFRPILPGPRSLRNDIIEAEEGDLFLLDCRLPEEVIRRDYPTLWDYLESGRETVGQTYLCRHRNPWYVQENRSAAPFLCTYMGRGTFRFILNKSNATATNVYLMLHPKPALAAAIERDPTLSYAIWRFLAAIPPETLVAEGRVYGGGLYKMEPRELANVPADFIQSTISTAAAGSSP